MALRPTSFKIDDEILNKMRLLWLVLRVSGM